MNPGKLSVLSRAVGIVRDRFWSRESDVATIAINLEPRRSPYGGGNQFVQLLSQYLEYYGYRVVYRLEEGVDLALIIDGREAVTTFSVADLEERRRSSRSPLVIHRVNECDKRKDTDFMDAILARTNAVADHTVFVSRWLKDLHAATWFDTTRPHSVILPGADPAIFHPVGHFGYPGQGPLRLVTHHWSDNMRKGFDVYTEIDRLIHNEALDDVELWVIGRWPAGTEWKAARLFGPTHGHELANLLRQCHAYVTASRFDPGPMHCVEGAACGLPVLFHVDGGGIPERVRRFGIEFSDNIVGGIHTLRQRYDTLRNVLVEDPPVGDAMCLAYRRLIQEMLCSRS